MCMFINACSIPERAEKLVLLANMQGGEVGG